VSQNEGNSGTTLFTFTVSLSNPSSQTITVNYATADGTATTADNDYSSTSGTLTFAPNETSKTISVSVNGDTKFEPNETFSVNLSLPVNATISRGQGLETITNDDALPAISINDVSQNEGDSGATLFTFTVSLSNPSSQMITVSYATADGTATTADNDYSATSGTLTFAANETSKTISVSVNGDTKFEPNETFTVNLSSPVNAVIADGQGLGTIINDDAAPTPTPTPTPTSTPTPTPTPTPTLASPTATSATNVTASSFIANWTSVSGATGYLLDVSTSNMFRTYVPG
jgi:hypothetical protein